jgi:hypothetical protein
MAITKLRLQQIQDEVADFGAANLANHNAAPDTLHDIMKNLTRNLKRRFGTEGVNGIENYYGQEAAHGTLAHYASGEAVDLLIKHEAAAQKIAMESAGAISADAAGLIGLTSTGGNVEADANKSFTAVAGEKVELSAGTELTASADTHMLISVGGDQAVSVTGNISEAAVEFLGDYTGKFEIFGDAASAIMTSVGNINIEAEAASVILSASATLDGNATDIDLDASDSASIVAGGTGEFKADGLLLSSSLGANLEAHAVIVVKAGSIVDMDAEALDADFLQAMNMTSNASSKFEVLGATSDFNLEAGQDLSAIAGRDIQMAATADLSASAAGIWVEATAGGLQLSGAAWIAASDSTLEATSSDEMLLKSTASFIDISAEGSFLRFDDSYRAAATLDAYYADGIKLAENASDWEDWQAAFGNKPLLKAISEAAAGSEYSARFVGVVTAAVAADTEALSSASISFTKYTAGATAAYTAGAHTVADYTAAEMDYAVEVYVNGQRLAQTTDFEVMDGSGVAFADAGTSMDVQIKFALEVDDRVEVVIK